MAHYEIDEVKWRVAEMLGPQLLPVQRGRDCRVGGGLPHRRPRGTTAHLR